MNIYKLFSYSIVLSLLISNCLTQYSIAQTKNVYKAGVQKHSTTASKTAKKKPLMSSNTKRILKYSAFGAGAGFVLSGKERRTTNILKGAAIGAGAGILTNPKK